MLGSGTAIPSLQRASPGYLIRAGGEHLLIDGGSGTLRQLLHAGVTIDQLDRLLYTHLHVDHTGDFVPLLFAYRSPRYGRKRPLPVLAVRGFRAFYDKLVAIYDDWIVSPDYPLSIQEVLNDTVELDGYRVITREVAHTRHTIACRIEAAGKAFVFSADTEPCPALVEVSRGADLAVFECSHPDGREAKGHLTPAQAGELAARAACKRLVLSHFYPDCEGVDLLTGCRKFFDGEVLLAEDLMRLTV